MAECILQGPGNFKTFHDLPYDYSPLDLMVFEDPL